MVIVAAVRSRSAVLAFGIALGNGRCHQRPDGALGFAISSFPIKAIVLPFITEDFLGVLVVLCGVVFLFRRHQLLANANGRHFIPANSPVQNFFLACLGVEIPRIAFVHERYGRGPILRADIQGSGSIRFFHQTVHFLIFLHEVSAALGVLGFVSRGDDLLPVWSEDIQHRAFVVTLHCRDQCVARVFRRWKCFLARLLRHGMDGKPPRQEDNDRG